MTAAAVPWMLLACLCCCGRLAFCLDYWDGSLNRPDCAPLCHLEGTEWSQCSNTCGAGTRTRNPTICCQKYESLDSCLGNCGISREDPRVTSSEACWGCENGGTSAGDQCRCPEKYTGSCCQQVVTCPQPANPDHGSVRTPGGLTYGESAVYSCDGGYVLDPEGDRVLKCEAWGEGGQGQWSGQPPTCFPLCETNLCENNGTCIQYSATTKTCRCAEPYCGDRCELKSDTCAGSPCENDGTCSLDCDTSSSTGCCKVTCECKRPWEGERCTNNTCSVSTFFDPYCPAHVAGLACLCILGIDIVVIVILAICCLTGALVLEDEVRYCLSEGKKARRFDMWCAAAVLGFPLVTVCIAAVVCKYKKTDDGLASAINLSTAE